MAKKRSKAPIFPLVATFYVVRVGGELKLRLLREQTSDGKIRPGRQVFTRTIFSALHVELFSAKEGMDTVVDVYERGIKVHWPSYSIVELGGHNNGSHALRSRGAISKSESVWLAASMFNEGVVVVVSGYSKSLKWGGSPHEADLAKL